MSLLLIFSICFQRKVSISTYPTPTSRTQQNRPEGRFRYSLNKAFKRPNTGFASLLPKIWICLSSVVALLFGVGFPFYPLTLQLHNLIETHCHQGQSPLALQKRLSLLERDLAHLRAPWMALCTKNTPIHLQMWQCFYLVTTISDWYFTHRNYSANYTISQRLISRFS